MSARKLWIAFGLPPAGAVEVDGGAVSALVAGGRSLLPVGVTQVAGDFAAGAAIEVLAPDGSLIGKGIVSMDGDVLRDAIGKHSSEAGGVVIHRDSLVVLR